MTKTQADVVSGTIIQSEMGYAKATFKLKKGVSVSDYERIEITEDYTSLDSTTTPIIFNGIIQDHSLTDIKEIDVVSKQDEVARIQPTGYYQSLVTAYLDKMVDKHGHFLSTSYPLQTWTGYYDAPYNFSYQTGNTFKNIDFVDDYAQMTNVDIVASLGGHNNVLRLDWLLHLFVISGIVHDFPSIQSSGSLEFWFQLQDANQSWQVRLYNEGGSQPVVVAADNGYIDSNIPISTATWYIMRFDFRCAGADAYSSLAEDQFRLSVFNSGGSHLTNSPKLKSFSLSSTNLDRIQFLNMSHFEDLGNLYIDSYGASWLPNYDIGDNLSQITYNLPVSTNVHIKNLNGGQSLQSMLIEAAMLEQYTWALAPDGDIRWHDGTESSGITLDGNQEVWDVGARIQTKKINRVVLKGAGGLEAVANNTGNQSAAGQIIIYKDYRADITDLSVLIDLAQAILDIQEVPPLEVSLSLRWEEKGWIQVGETIHIDGSVIKYNNSSSYIPAGDYRIVSETYHMQDGKYSYIELVLQDGLQYIKQLDKDKIDQNTQNANTAYGGTIISGGSGAGGTGISSVADDPSPQLGGDLDLSGYEFSSSGALNLKLSNDSDDYLQLSTVANVPTIEAIGSAYLDLTSSDGKSTILRLSSTETAAIRLYADRDNDDETKHASIEFYQDTVAVWFKCGIGEALDNNDGFLQGSTPINIMPSADSDNYLQFYTDAGTPKIKIIGGDSLALEADGDDTELLIINTVDDAILHLDSNDDCFIYLKNLGVVKADMTWNKGQNAFHISSASAIRLRPSGITADYLEFYTSGGVPRIKIVGDAPLQFEADNDDVEIILNALTDGKHVILDLIATSGENTTLKWRESNDLFGFSWQYSGTPNTYTLYRHDNNAAFDVPVLEFGRTTNNWTSHGVLAMSANKITGVAKGTDEHDVLTLQHNLIHTAYDPVVWTEAEVAPSRLSVKDVFVSLTNAVVYKGTWSPSVTYNFTEDLDLEGSNIPFLQSGVTGLARIDLQEDGREYILYLSNDGSNVSAYSQEFSSPQVTGEIEWWWKVADATGENYTYLYHDTNYGPTILIASDTFWWRNAADVKIDTGVECLDDTWYKIKLVFDSDADTYDYYVNDVKIATGIAYRRVGTGIIQMRFLCNNDVDMWIDSVKYSWQDGYPAQPTGEEKGWWYLVDQDGYSPADDDSDTPARWYELGDWIIWNETRNLWDILRNVTGDNILKVSPGDPIQVAIDEIETVGEGSILLLPGRHVISAHLDIGDINSNVNIEIRGFGDVSEIYLDSNINAFDINAGSSVVLKDFKIDADQLTADLTTIIDLAGVIDRPIIENVNIYGDGTHGKGIYSLTTDTVVRNCYIENVNYGIDIRANRGKIYENHIKTTDVYGIYLRDSNYHQVTDNYIEGGDDIQKGINIRNVEYASLTDNIILDCTSGGIMIVTQSDRNTVVGNSCTGCLVGIDIETGDYNAITANFCADNTDGIQLGIGASNNFITVNMLENNTNNIDDNSDGTNYILNDLRNDLVFRCRSEVQLDAAIAEIGAGSGTIQIIGTVTLSGPIALNAGASIIIEGHGDISVIDINGNYDGFDVTDCASCEFRDLKVDCTAFTGAVHVFHIDEVADNPVTIRNVTIVGNGSGEAISYQSDHVLVTECRITNVEIGIGDIGSGSGDYSIISNNFFDNTQYGVALLADHTVFADNRFVSGGGIFCSGDYNSITGNIISGGDANIEITVNAHHNVISNNVIVSTIQTVARATGAIRLFSNCDYNVISNNIIYNNSNASGTCYGIEIQASDCAYNIIVGNRIDSNETGSILDNGTATKIFADDTVFGSGWNGDLGTPSKNAVYDKLNAVDGEAGLAYDGSGIGAGNAAWIACPYEENSDTGKVFKMVSATYENTSGADCSMSFTIPLPTTRGGLNLYIGDIRVDVWDGDGDDYVTACTVYGLDYNSLTAVHTSTGNVGSGGQATGTYSFTPASFGSYQRASIYLAIVLTTAGQFNLSSVTAEYYYA